MALSSIESEQHSFYLEPVYIYICFFSLFLILLLSLYSYFTELAEELPDDTLILTLGCAKNRFIHSKKLLGQTLANGMPRILDMGQCNDSYSAIVVATELAKALDCTVNDLPLSLCLSHLEQKAAAVLLTLLQMGVKNIRLGPSLPAYITPNVLDVLVQNYNIMPTGDVQGDIKMMMEGNQYMSRFTRVLGSGDLS